MGGNVGALERAVKKARRARFSQQAFADRCQVHRTYMGSVERGISLDNIEKIAKGIGLSPGDLLLKAARERKDTGGM